MSKTISSAFLAVPLIVAASLHSPPIDNVYHLDYALASDAMILVPIAIPNEEYVDAAASLYLEPQGFDGTATTLVIPQLPTLQQSIEPGVQILVDALQRQFDANAFDAADPLYIFGYSQSAVVASMAQQQLSDYGIPSDYLHFVLVGDSASAHGGWLNSYVDSLPEWLRQFTTQVLTWFGFGDILGATTPNDLYPTDVYTLSGDGWANWDGGANISGLFVDHLEYLGLTPEEISSATMVADGLTDYFTIDSTDVDELSALWNGLMIITAPIF